MAKTYSMAFKYRIFPTEEQKHQIAVNSGCARYVWNRMLAMNNEAYREHGKAPRVTTYQPLIAQWKKEEETAWLKEADAYALIYANRSLDQAFKNFFKNPSHYGKPKFKKKSHYQSYRIQARGTDGTINFENMTIKLGKLGRVTIDYHRPIKGRPVAATISRNPAGEYYVSITVKDAEVEPMPKAKQSTGIDLGIHDLIVDAQGNHYPNPKHTYKLEKKLAHAQRILSKKKKGSANWHKQRIRVAKIQQTIANARRHNIHVMTHELVKNNSTICAESLNVKGMLKNHHLAKAISDSSFGEICRQLEYKCEWNERKFIQIDTWFPSSKTCSACGHVLDELKLSTRKWTCSKCGAVHDRDHNAAKNILIEGLSQS